MKKNLLFLFLIGSLYSCTNKQVANSTNQIITTQTQQKVGEESLIDIVNSEISKIGISDRAILILNGIKIDKEELELLNQFKLQDFTDITAVNKNAATKIYGQEGIDGAVIITSFTDELLGTKYYSDLKNKTVVNTISELNSQGLINRNPILVVNGVPLRGEDIAHTINSLSQNDIEKINLLKKQTAYSIYGIRAINGVLLIDTKK